MNWMAAWNPVHRYLSVRSPMMIVIVSAAAIGVLGVVNAQLSSEVSFSLFYLIPIAVVAWYAGGVAGVIASVVAALVWFIASHLPRSYPATAWIPYWNLGVRFCFFLTVVVLLSALRTAFERERGLARIDGLTKLFTSRAFFEAAAAEFSRARRYLHPFTIAYLDVDNFKLVNDQFGHAEGDRVLATVGDTLRRHLRSVDVAARLGGDEFALLLPETDAVQADAAIAKLRASLLQAMEANDWKVTFSIGAVACDTPPDTVEEVVKRADAVMYEVKRRQKDDFALTVFP